MKDRIPVKIGDVIFKLAPMSAEHKREILGCYSMDGGENLFDHTKATLLSIKYSLKGVKGLTDVEGNDYKLDFENDHLTEDCISELLSLEMSDKLIQACFAFLNGVQKVIKDPRTGKKIAGIEVLPADGTVKK